MISEHYKGREQAYIKHTLLKHYLTRLFMIIGQRASTICYVDCFAGPWQEEGKDLEDTSIAVSLNIMRDCRESLRKSGKNVHFRALFLEKDPKAFDKLKPFLKKEEYKQIETHCLKGEFVDLMDVVLEWCGNKDFTFFFIDPKGWKDIVEPSTLQPLLKRSNSEFLINFMYDFIVRAHTQERHNSDMVRIFGEVPNTSEMEPKEIELTLLKKYRSNLKNCMPSNGKIPRAACVKVQDPLKDRTKYGLIYLTSNEYGIVVFMNESEKMDVIQKKVRSKTKENNRIEQTNQFELGLNDDAIERNTEISTIRLVKKYWLEKLSTTPEKYDNIKYADMLEDTDWFPSYFQLAFKELAQEGKVENLDATKPRRKNPVHFEKNERLRKLD